jgi:carboxylate-amine ligase
VRTRRSLTSPPEGAASAIPKTYRMRTVGVEEEMLLVEAETGEPVAMAEAVVGHHHAHQAAGDAGSTPGGTLDTELQQQMIETDTAPTESLAELGLQVRRARARADQVARQTGARVVALGTSPIAVAPHVTPKPRYTTMLQHFGLTTAEQLTCGCHVHVSIESPEEGVQVLDRIRVWLPVLLALSANSPFWQGQDSGYASFRSQAWNRFPTAGPSDVFGSAAAYHGLVDALLGSGVSLDRGMIYFDARLSASYPTLEIRIADVCLDAADTVLIAALARALVETAARDWRAGVGPPQMATEMIRVAGWRAGRSALAQDLIDPGSGTPRPAAEVVAALVAHVAAALQDSGDRALVDETVARLLAHGPGASRQRELYARSADLRAVLLEAADLTQR